MEPKRLLDSYLPSLLFASPPPLFMSLYRNICIGAAASLSSPPSILRPPRHRAARLPAVARGPVATVRSSTLTVAEGTAGASSPLRLNPEGEKTSWTAALCYATPHRVREEKRKKRETTPCGELGRRKKVSDRIKSLVPLD